MTKIEWTDTTWNPVTGCTKVSQGCKNCYAERMAKRLQAMGKARYRNGFDVTLHPDALALPLKWKKPRRVFVNSMSDLFHPDVPWDFLDRVFAVMAKAEQHVFQVLTKRPLEMRDYIVTAMYDESLVYDGFYEQLDALGIPDAPPSDNVWFGTSVENRRNLDRVDALRQVPAALRFLSLEPLLEDLGELDLEGIGWVIVGGESGPKARRIDETWVRSIQRQCSHANVPFFFKQWGGPNKKKAGRILDGSVWEEMPV